MANDLNVVCIVGNLVRDCGSNDRDFVYTQGGMAIATISIASNRSKKQSDGTWADDVSYFDIHLYGKMAENLKSYLVKGQKIAVEGVLKQERWQDKQTGNNMSKIVINAITVQLVGGKRDNQNEGTQQYQNGYSQQQSKFAQQYQNQNQNQNPFAQQNKVYNGTAPQYTTTTGQVQQQNGFQEDLPWSDSDIPF